MGDDIHSVGPRMADQTEKNGFFRKLSMLFIDLKQYLPMIVAVGWIVLSQRKTEKRVV